jgi:hypothetical protein
MFYLMHEDEETQKKGSVLVVALLGDFHITASTPAEVVVSAKVNTHAPMRVSVLHALLGEANAGFGHLIDLYLKLGDKETRARAKLHHGRGIGVVLSESPLARASPHDLGFSYRGAY